MPLRYLLDENQRGALWHIIQGHNALGIDTIDAVRVGDTPHLPFGADDLTILRWAERAQRNLVTFDKSSMSAHLAAHLVEGNPCPGIFMLPAEARPSRVLEFLVLAAYASEPAEWADWINLPGRRRLAVRLPRRAAKLQALDARLPPRRRCPGFASRGCDRSGPGDWHELYMLPLA